MDNTFHYPPDLMNLLVDAIPRLCRGKDDTLLFLKGAGISDTLTGDLWKRVESDRKGISKFYIVRTVLTRLNERGESALRERREVVKRVVEFEDFSACWETERLKAQGLVAQIQKIVNIKDSFTRMKDERERERRGNIAKQERAARAQQDRKDAIEQLKAKLFSLFQETNTHKRGKKLEGLLNRLFQVYDISIRKDFTVTGDEGEGVIEQVDGVIKLDNHLYFVEMKWWKDPLGVPEISDHMMRVMFRDEARAIIISASDFTAPAVTACKKALSQKVVTLCTLQEIVMLLEQQYDLAEFLRRKVDATIIDTNPFPHVEMP